MGKPPTFRTIDARAEEILARMTTEEKIGQTHQISPSIVGGFDLSFEELIEMMTTGRITQAEFQNRLASAERDFHEADICAGRVGSFLLDDPAEANRLQRIAVEESRLGIPLLIGFDVIHGHRTVFPIPLAEACAFDPEGFEKTAAIAAREARARGIAWVFSPMLDLSRDARWGRVSESFGEDPYLGGVYAAAKLRGLQGERDAEGRVDKAHVAACLKHYAGYGAAEGGRDYNSVGMAKSLLYNAYLPPFRRAVEAGAMTVMAGFHDLNGVPCTVNRFLLRDVLKDGWGFEGLVVSDANAVAECVTHGVARDRTDAAVMALEAGVDIDMGSGCYMESLRQALETGRVSMAALDDAVRRILRVKLALGLFENPYASETAAAWGEAPDAERRAITREAAGRSIVLLKNEGVLPLQVGARVLLTGALADRPAETLGAWAIAGRPSDCVSIRQGMESRSANPISYIPCCGPEGGINEDEFAALSGRLDDTDVIVAVVGETAAMSGEAASRADITLPGSQREFLRRLLATGKPVVACLMNGRPLALDWEDGHLPAIVECWQLGVEMGNAVSDILYGDAEPMGRLSASFPAMSGQCPLYYNHPSTGRPGSGSKFTSRYIDAPLGALYPFGYGLSYTGFAYSGLAVKEAPDALEVDVTLENTGARAGTETAQLYMQDVTASIVRPVKELKGFQKVKLAAGERRRLHFTLFKRDMGFYNDEGEYRLEDGEFRLHVGGNARDCLTESVCVRF